MAREHDHDHGHEHEPEQAHEHDHEQEHGPGGLTHRLRHLMTPHSHDTGDKVDAALSTSSEGLRALWISFGLLMATALAQAVVVVFTGSVALLSDTLHNLADGLTAIPLAIAFLLGRRAPTRRYTYGFGRAEDLAGLFVVAVIAASAVAAGWTAVQRFVEPRPVEYLGAVAAAGVIGFLGNEWVARYRISVGRRIGSAALIADGLHARTDGFTSLAVVLSAIGVGLGFEQADPLVGLLITVAILYVLRDAAVQVWRRLMDAVEPQLVDHAERVLAATPGVREVAALRLRWSGHELSAATDLVVDGDLSLRDAHRIAEDAEHRLLHEIPRLTRVLVHTDPEGHDHLDLDHHR